MIVGKNGDCGMCLLYKGLVSRGGSIWAKYQRGHEWGYLCWLWVGYEMAADGGCVVVVVLSGAPLVASGSCCSCWFEAVNDIIPAPLGLTLHLCSLPPLSLFLCGF